MRILYCVVAIALTGCAPQYVWYHPNLDLDSASRQQRIDVAECQAYAMQAVPLPNRSSEVNVTAVAATNNSTVAAGGGGDIIRDYLDITEHNAATNSRDNLTEACMLRRGWEKVPANGQQNIASVRTTRQQTTSIVPHAATQNPSPSTLPSPSSLAPAERQSLAQRAVYAIAAAKLCMGKMTDRMNDLFGVAVRQEGIEAIDSAENNVRALWTEIDAAQQREVCSLAVKNGWIEYNLASGNPQSKQRCTPEDSAIAKLAREKGYQFHSSCN